MRARPEKASVAGWGTGKRPWAHPPSLCFHDRPGQHVWFASIRVQCRRPRLSTIESRADLVEMNFPPRQAWILPSALRRCVETRQRIFSSPRRQFGCADEFFDSSNVRFSRDDDGRAVIRVVSVMMSWGRRPDGNQISRRRCRILFAST